MVAGPAGRELLTADAYVVALGSYSPLLLRPLGLRLPLIPVKGYSATLPLQGDSGAPTVSLTDDGDHLLHGAIVSRSRRRVGPATMPPHSCPPFSSSAPGPSLALATDHPSRAR